MTLERLSNFLGNDYQRNYLQKIYLAQKLQEQIQKIVPGECTVIIKSQTLVIEGTSPVYLQALKLHQRAIYAQIKRITPELYRTERPKLQFRLKRSNYSS